MNAGTIFSVLICTNNRHELLRKSLHALIKDTVEKPDEIVIINGGDERANRVVDSFGRSDGINIKSHRTVNKNLAASRNLGLEHCTGDIIAMTDDDAQVYPDWVRLMKQNHMRYPEAGAVGGPAIAIDKRKIASRIADKVTFPSWPDARFVRTIPTVNLSYKAEIVKKIGAQDEELWTGEDVDFNWRLSKLGYKILFDPNIKVKHHHPTTVRSLWMKHYAYGRGYYLLRSKWKDMHCIYPHSLRKGRDFLKLANFFAAIFYEPLMTASSMDSNMDKLVTFPIQFANHILWRIGMFAQYNRHRRGVFGR